MKFFSFSFVIAVILAYTTYQAVFLVDQTEYAFRLQFGSPVGDTIKTPGIYFHIPYIQTIVKYDNRLLDFEGDSTLLPTKDKKYIYVDTFARWKITDPLQFYQSIGNYKRAQQVLDGVIDSTTGGVISSYNLVEVVRSSNNILETVDKSFQTLAETGIEKIQTGRKKIQIEILQKAKKAIKNNGIDILAVRFKKIALEENVLKKVFERMISERKKIASQIRAEGMGKKVEIEGRAFKEKSLILAESRKQAAQIQGEADAKSAQIYAESYKKNTDFFEFYRTLKSYKKTLSKKTTLLMNKNDPYLSVLQGQGVLSKKPK